jgi:hypothetical protein
MEQNHSGRLVGKPHLTGSWKGFPSPGINPHFFTLLPALPAHWLVG